MPIEIKELHIRVTVNDAPEKEVSSSKEGSGPAPSPITDKCTQNALVADCVEQVLQILQEKKER